ncbi:MAG TPA: methyltransferase, partial [Thermoanaerobaculia bacterium]|nr:methyltransferase [Thermoanaerobaculia bacterium]
GDVYDPVPPDERFDLIFWNMPFGFVEPDRQLTPLQRSNLDPGYASVRRYLTEAHRHLADGGLLTLGFSMDLGRLELIEELAAGAGLKVRIARSADAVPDRPYDLRLLHLLPG